MKAFRKFAAVAACGVALGVGMSAVSAAPATARFYNCDQRITSMEKQSARDYAKGKLSYEDYLKVQEEIAFHRALWGC